MTHPAAHAARLARLSLHLAAVAFFALSRRCAIRDFSRLALFAWMYPLVPARSSSLPAVFISSAALVRCWVRAAACSLALVESPAVVATCSAWRAVSAAFTGARNARTWAFTFLMTARLCCFRFSACFIRFQALFVWGMG